eukprot:GDKI01049722.1.p1 GENE.GDKI01049722.1~~GDKI01049722.1.p1  ORF type:complete len:245 (-),score=63.19 GDKI01049722.1:229-963(-)
MSSSSHAETAQLKESVCPTDTNAHPQLTLHLCALAAHTAAGNYEQVKAVWKSLQESEHVQGLEAIFMVHFLAGAPRVIEALSAVHSTGVCTSAIKQLQGENAMDIRTGAENDDEKQKAYWFDRVYGGVAGKLHTELERLHPHFSSVVLNHAYGKMYGRPYLSFVQKELCTVSVMCYLKTPRQLYSHLRGALKAGASPQVCECVLKHMHAQGCVDGGALSEAVGVLEKVVCAGGVKGSPSPTSRH